MGIILYEFLIGVVPFFGDNVDELFDQITSEEVEPEFPEDFPLPDEAENLIKCLLVRNPSERLGSHGNGELSVCWPGVCHCVMHEQQFILSHVSWYS